MKKEIKNKGFTLVELLAVIVILAIILVIAVPKVMSIIEDAKKGTLESTAKMIASGAEKAKVQNTVLGNNEEITCDSIAKINKGDYANCEISFEENIAKVTIEGSGKFDGLWVCNGTKTNALAQKESCVSPLQVRHPLFLKGQEITPDKFEVTLIESDGSTKKLWSGGLKYDESKIVTASSPNWPNPYTIVTNEVWEYTFEGADEIQISFDANSSLGYDVSIFSEYTYKGYIYIYDENSNLIHSINTNQIANETYKISGEYIKIIMNADNENAMIKGNGFSAKIEPIYNLPAEYTITPSIVPNIDGNFDITITLNDDNFSKKVTASVGQHNVKDYVTSHNGFDTIQTNAIYNELEYDTGIRYVGSMDEVKNKVYYNCDDTDINGVAYGEDTYNYASSCEVWRIIGVFDTKTNTSGDAVPRVKLINTASTFGAPWDSSYGYLDGVSNQCIGVNCGYGINQWGESTYEDGTFYEGADIMRLLNGYYIGKNDSNCVYCFGLNQYECSEICTADSLKEAKMKVLTSTAKAMIENAVWDTYAVEFPIEGDADSSWASTAYLQEKGISKQYTGKSLCVSNGDGYCNDGVTRTTSWTGLVGLISVSDMTYANGWLYARTDANGLLYTRTTITPIPSIQRASDTWDSINNFKAGNNGASGVSPSVYLKSNIKVIGGNGDTEPYILAI